MTFICSSRMTEPSPVPLLAASGRLAGRPAIHEPTNVGWAKRSVPNVHGARATRKNESLRPP
jgi:hypothetical protein